VLTSADLNKPAAARPLSLLRASSPHLRQLEYCNLGPLCFMLLATYTHTRHTRRRVSASLTAQFASQPSRLFCNFCSSLCAKRLHFIFLKRLTCTHEHFLATKNVFFEKSSLDYINHINYKKMLENI
jgi:hypothetical protein